MSNLAQRSKNSASNRPPGRRLLLRWVLRSILPAYVGIHVYAYLQLSAAWAPNLGIQVLLGIGLALMIGAPFFVRRLDKKGYSQWAAALAWTGYTWMGFIFLFFFISLGTHFFITVSKAIASPGYFPTHTVLLNQFNIALGLSLGLSVYAFWQAAWPRLVRIPLFSPRLSPGLRLRLVQISDLHLGLLSTPRRLQRIAQLINSVSPDCIVSTGDFTDLRTDQSCPGIVHLAGIKTPMGKYAVTGNHECYAGLTRSEQVLQEAGFTLLRQRCINLDGGIQIVGVDDPVAVGGRPHLEREALRYADPEKFTVLLKHRPELEPSMTGCIDLQLSGHTHDGQIFPFTLLPRLLYRARPGLTRFGRAALYLSRGTGTWGPPMRFPFASEITLFEIEGKS